MSGVIRTRIRVVCGSAMRDSTSLSAFLAKSGANRKHRNYQTAANRFEKYLEREALLSDLTNGNLADFKDWLATQSEWTKKQCNQTLWRVRWIWRKAHQLGLASDPGDHRRSARNRAIFDRLEPWQRAELPPRSLAVFFEKIYRPLRLRNKSARTVELYGYSIRCFSHFLERHATLDDFSDETVSAHLVALSDRGLSAHSIEKERSQLLAMWRFACRKNLLTIHPDIMAGPLPTRIPAGWTVDDLEKLWQAIARTKGKVEGVPAAAWWRALHFVLIYSAERIGAVWALRWDKYDPVTGWITFTAESRKGGRADNSVRLPADAMAALEEIRGPERELIFPVNHRMIYYRYKRLLKSAGLPTDCKSMFHRMRKTAASHYEAAGGNATALLGHTSRKVTMAYLDPRIVKPPQAADLLSGIVERFTA